MTLRLVIAFFISCAVSLGEFAQAIASAGGGRLDWLIAGIVRCRVPGHWRSRIAGCDPSRVPSSRSSPARLALDWSGLPAPPALRRDRRQRLLGRSAACWAWAAPPRE